MFLHDLFPPLPVQAGDINEVSVLCDERAHCRHVMGIPIFFPCLNESLYRTVICG